MNAKTGSSRARRALALALCAVMMLALLPVSALAATGETVTAVAAPEQSAYFVASGTALAELGLPEELTATVSAGDGETAETREESLAASWDGGYDAAAAGVYVLTASFGEAVTVAADVVMPSVTVTVAEPEAGSAAPLSAEAPTLEEPAVEEQAAEAPTLEAPVAEEPAVEEPVVEAPPVEEAAAEEPASEEPAGEPVALLGEGLPEASRTSITWDGHTAADTSYNLATDSKTQFNVNYKRSTSSAETPVLVVSCLEYGARFAALVSSASSTAVASSAWLNAQHTAMALRLNPLTLDDEDKIGFQMESRALTQDNCIYWMDNGALPPTNLSVQDYTFTGTDLTQVLTGGTLISDTDFAPAGLTPANYSAAAITNEYSYSVGVSSIQSLASWMLGEEGYGYVYNNAPQSALGPQKQPELSYTLPSAHTDNEPLIEITGLKIYVPGNNANLSLAGIGGMLANGKYSNTLIHDWYGSSFSVYWENWTVSERLTDGGGAYYLLTPPEGTRIFNNGTDATLGTLRMGGKLTWAVSGELPYEGTAMTTLAAEDTVLHYKIPGGAAAATSGSFSHTGPVLHVYARKNGSAGSDGTAKYWWQLRRDKWSFTYDRSDYLRTVGVSYSEETTGYFNSYYCDTYTNGAYEGDPDKACWTEYVPTYTGSVTRSFSFPFEVQPSSITLYSASFNFGWLTDFSRVLTSLSYTLKDGTVLSADAETVAAINTEFAKTGDISYTFSFAGATAANPVVNVTEVWGALYMKSAFAFVGQDRMYSGASSNFWSSCNHVILLEESFAYTISETRADGTAVAQNTDVQAYFSTTYDQADPSAPADFYQTDSSAAALWYRLVNQSDVAVSGAGNGWPQHKISNYYTPQLADGKSYPIVDWLGLNVGQKGTRQDILKNPSLSVSAAVGALSSTADGMPALAFFDGSFKATTRSTAGLFPTPCMTRTPRPTAIAAIR